MRTREFAAGVCSGREVSLMIAHSHEYPMSGVNCNTAVNYQHSVSLVSCAIRVLSESIFISYDMHVELALAACRSFRVVLSNSRSSL